MFIISMNHDDIDAISGNNNHWLINELSWKLLMVFYFLDFNRQRTLFLTNGSIAYSQHWYTRIH